MKFLIVFFISCYSVAFAQACPQFSGKFTYSSTGEDDQKYDYILEVVQTNCNKLESKIDEAGSTASILIIDGLEHVVPPKYPGNEYDEKISSVTFWDFNKLVSKNKRVQYNDGGGIEFIETNVRTSYLNDNNDLYTEYKFYIQKSENSPPVLKDSYDEIGKRINSNN